MKQLITALTLITTSTLALATSYDITAVLAGTDGGFAYSGFHYAGNAGTGVDGDANPMTGSSIALIPAATGLFGSYNDATGAFSLSTGVNSAAGPSFSLSGNLIFDGAGVLSASSVLALTFANPGADLNAYLVDSSMVFASGLVCCGGASYAPNSLLSDGSGGKVISLWGADFTSTGDATLGLDLRLALQPVPVPAALWLFASGLVGLVVVARRHMLDE